MTIENNCKFLLGQLCTSPINKNCKSCDLIPKEWCYYKQLQEEKESSVMTSKIFATAIEQYQEQIKKLNQTLRVVGNRIDRQISFNEIHHIADEPLKEASQIIRMMVCGKVDEPCQANGAETANK